LLKTNIQNHITKLTMNNNLTMSQLHCINND
jgi:hypothetical protein